MWNGFVAMALPKQEEKKNCGNAIAEIEERDINKVSILFFQYFFD